MKNLWNFLSIGEQSENIIIFFSSFFFAIIIEIEYSEVVELAALPPAI